jgi:lipoprotein-releasing system ATP-binding protein
MNEPLLEFLRVTKEFRETAEPVVLFRDLDFALQSGHSVSLMGESGTGKSTFLQLAAGLDTPSSGAVLLGGREISSLPVKDLNELRAQGVGLVFQFHFLLKEFSVLENVLLPAWLAGTPRVKATKRALELLEQVGLSARQGHFPAQLSGGEKQRAALARALINDPPLVLADEPTGNLDERNAALVQDLLLRLVVDHHKTLLLVTHDKVFAGRTDLSYRLTAGKLERS